MNMLKIFIYIIALSVSTYYLTSCAQKHNTNNHEHTYDEADEHDNHNHENDHSNNNKQKLSLEEPGHDDHEDDAHSDEIELNSKIAAEVGIIVQPISLRTLDEVKTFPGTVVPRPNGEAHVGSLVGGRVVAIPVGLGEKVTEGTVLCKIESPEVGTAQANYIRAYVQDELAQKDLVRQQKLKAEDIGSEKSLIEKQATARAAAAELAASKRTLLSIGFSQQEISQLIKDHSASGVLTLRSPVNGTITDLNVHLGQRVNTDQDLFHIVDLMCLWVQISLYEKDLPYVVCRQPASISPQSLPEQIFKGKIVQIGREVHQETRTVKMFIEVRNRNNILIPNLFVSAQLPLSTATEQKLAVPEDALVMDERGNQSVFIEHEPFRYVLKEITTGKTNNGWVEVINGLQLGDRVVFKGAFFIKSEASKGVFGHGHAH